MNNLKMIAIALVASAAAMPASGSTLTLPGGSFDGCLNWCDENVPGPSAQNNLCHAQCGKDYPQGRKAASPDILGKLD
jgi:hypothetical protein